MLPVYEKYIVKLTEGKTFNDFIATLPVMGYISSQTRVVSVIDITKDGQKTNVDFSEYELAVRSAFEKKDENVKVDYQKDFENLKKVNEGLLERLSALEANQGGNERKQLFIEARELGLTPMKNIATEALKEMIENKKSK
jgi:hypothetical protein